ncbi:hypothetical protein EV356DRAFT_496401 [Viridothelium virens]|uniref:Prion-inhibition and propagation HeLo domain-containing protein n=1 Tax=Viridothelium virens TaxID=1048519 RepID=A0A6A6GV45_VIRVR|nr:hypothetical protein EV356DRAFT_496401 [Viridothelium virens]
MEALSVIALVAAFKGAVDSYLLIESFFDNDNGSSYLALRYHIEQYKLILWGDFFKTSDPMNCTLANQPRDTIELIALILEEIQKTH